LALTLSLEFGHSPGHHQLLDILHPRIPLPPPFSPYYCLRKGSSMIQTHQVTAQHNGKLLPSAIPAPPTGPRPSTPSTLSLLFLTGRRTSRGITYFSFRSAVHGLPSSSDPTEVHSRVQYWDPPELYPPLTTHHPPSSSPSSKPVRSPHAIILRLL
jgi:hypothetical protein